MVVKAVAHAQASASGEVQEKHHWVGIWATMQQLVEPHNLPRAPFNGPGVVFADTTLRQTIQVMQTASTVRLQLSNTFGVSDLLISAATLALPADGCCGSSAIEPSTLKPLTFSGLPSFTIPTASSILSDPVSLPLQAGSVVTVTLYLADGQASPPDAVNGNSATGHPGSRTTSYLTPGNLVDAVDVAGPQTQTEDHWYIISSLEAWLPQSVSSVVVIGDSLTDGHGATVNGSDRWPDVLHRRLQEQASTRSVSVLNQAAGGNRILLDGLGPNALGRLERDVLSQPAARWAIVFEGINDIGKGAPDADSQAVLGQRLVAAYTQIAQRLHAFGIAVFGCTITPFCGPGQPYSDPERERTRQRLNAWIRESGNFDAVVDFDRAVRREERPDMLRDEFNLGDFLHMNPAGYAALGNAVDLALFEEFRHGSDRMI